MSDNDHILKCTRLFKSYKMGQTRLKVLKGLDLEIEHGEFVAVKGASGSGKSTLLHILGALDKPDKGAVLFKGAELGKYSQTRLNEFRNKKVGFVFQFYHLLEELTVLENIKLPAMVSVGTIGWLKCSKKAQKRALELLEMLSLTDRAKHKPYQLSGGERQRVAIGRALMNSPELLLADEPTGNLDSATGNGILKIFDRFHSAGQTIIMVTHDEKIAEKADRTINLFDGKVV